MNGDLIKTNDASHRWSDDLIDMQNYTVSLLQCCTMNSLIKKEKIFEIKKSFEDEFIELANQYTKRESSTLPKEKAECIYRSVLYQSDVLLLSLNNHDKAVEALSILPPCEIINRGKELTMNYYYKCKMIYDEALRYNLDINVFEYRYVMDTAFNEFYTNYSARFDAENIVASIDYPLLNEKPYEMKQKGVLFIKDYYTAIMLENKFCKMFDEKSIEKLLNNYGVIYKCKYTALLFNITEIVANSFFVRLLNGRNDLSLELHIDDIENLYKMYSGCSDTEFKDEMKKAIKKCDQLYRMPSVFMFIKKYSERFSDELHRRIKEGNAENYISFERD